MRSLFFLGGLVLFVSVLVGEEPVSAPATPTTKPPLKRRMRPPYNNQLKVPETIIGLTEPERPRSADTTLGGTVPALWEPKPPRLEDEELTELMERETIAPPVPAKVVRYAVHLLAHYDTNGDGVLQREEWSKMPGTPQAIDLDGDGVMTLDEWVRYLGVYGEKRTIHRPNPIETFYQPRVVSSQFQLFKPLSAPPPKQETSAKEETPPTEDMTEESVAAGTEAEDKERGDDTTHEDIVAGTMTPTEKKYYTRPEALRGVPAWFLRLDRDGDGQVSLVEFAPNMSPASLALFGKLDKNGDGFITPDEVRKEEPLQKPIQPPDSGGGPPSSEAPKEQVL